MAVPGRKRPASRRNALVAQRRSNQTPAQSAVATCTSSPAASAATAYLKSVAARQSISQATSGTTILVDAAGNAPVGWQVARTNHEAIALIVGSPAIASLWLGWDAGAPERNFSKVATYLIESARGGHRLPIGEIVVHTDNPAAADVLQQKLGEAGYNVRCDKLACSEAISELSDAG